MEMKHGLKYYIKIYWMIVSQDIKSKMQYRADFIISSLGMLATNLSGLFSFWLLFQTFPSIMGWNYNEMLFLYGFSLLALTPVQLFFDNIWTINQHVYRGSFIKYCFRPMNIFFYYMSEVFDVKGLSQLVVGGGIIAYSWIKMDLAFTFGSAFLLLIALFSASLVMIAIMVFASATAFWIMNSMSVLMFMFKFKDYAKYPITIFNPLFRFIFTFIIPIAFISFYPSLIFLRPEENHLFAILSPVMGILFFYLSYKVWMKGALRYSGTGN